MDNANKYILNFLYYLKGLNCSTLYSQLYKQWHVISVEMNAFSHNATFRNQTKHDMQHKNPTVC